MSPLPVLLACTWASAQISGLSDLDRVDQGFDDAGALMQSHRELNVDLRLSSSFEHVFRLPGAGAAQRGPADIMGSEDLYMRVNGSLLAVFPRSIYVVGEEGVFASVPPGTVFYIGDLPPAIRDAMALPEAEVPAFNELDQSVLLQPPTRAVSLSASERSSSRNEAMPEPRPERRPMPSVWTSDDFRAARVGQILSRAARADETAPRR
jgi:hypothetical protein